MDREAWLLGFPGGTKNHPCQCRRRKRYGFDLWVGKISWRRTWQLTPVFLPGEFHRQGTWQATVRILLSNLAWAASHFLNYMAHSDSLLRADHDEWLRFTARETEQKISRSRCLPSPTTSPLSLLLVKWWYLFTISSQAYADFKSSKNWVTEAVFWPTSCIHSSQTHVLEYKGLVIHFCSSASLIRDTHCSCHALSDIMEISRLRALDSDAAGKKKKIVRQLDLL